MARPEFCMYMLKLVCALRQILSEKYSLKKDKQALPLIKNIQLGRFTFFAIFSLQVEKWSFPPGGIFSPTQTNTSSTVSCAANDVGFSALKVH